MIDSYQNIQTTTVSKWISFPWRKTGHFKEGIGKRQKTIEKVIEGEWKIILNYIGTYRNERDGAVQIQKVSGNSYRELLENLEAYKDEILEKIASESYEFCPECHGSGMRKKKEN